jgi:hypothetical protein
VCGQTQEGIAFENTMFFRPIQGNWGGQATQDMIFLGNDWTSMCTFLEADAAAMVDIIKPFNGSATDLNMGQPGIIASQHGVAKSMVLTSLLTAAVINASGTSGQTAVLPLTRTLPRTIRDGNYPIRELFDVGLRDIPVRFRHLPSARTQATGVGGGVVATET